MEATPALDNQQHDTEELEDQDAPERNSQPRPTVKGKIKFESVMQRGEAVAYFGALVDGLRHGQLQFRYGGEHLSLAPSEQVAVGVKASKKGDKEKVAFELEWKTASSEDIELVG